MPPEEVTVIAIQLAALKATLDLALQNFGAYRTEAGHRHEQLVSKSDSRHTENVDKMGSVLARVTILETKQTGWRELVIVIVLTVGLTVSVLAYFGKVVKP